VYFTRDLEQGVGAAELQELAQDSGRADTGGSGDTVVARLDAATRVREGQGADLWVDVRAIHVFDPSTGANLALADGPAQHTAASAAAPPAQSLADEPAPAPDASDRSAP
jgi:hypothetical protein